MKCKRNEGRVVAIVKTIPAKHSGPGVSCKTTSGQEFRISQDPVKMEFTLWKVLPGGYEKLAAAGSPVALYDKIPWNK